MRGVRGYAGYLLHEDKWYSIVYIANGAINSAEARATFTRLLTGLFTQQPLPPLPTPTKKIVAKGKKHSEHSEHSKSSKKASHKASSKSSRKGKKR